LSSTIGHTRAPDPKSANTKLNSSSHTATGINGAATSSVIASANADAKAVGAVASTVEEKQQPVVDDLAAAGVMDDLEDLGIIDTDDLADLGIIDTDELPATEVASIVRNDSSSTQRYDMRSKSDADELILAHHSSIEGADEDEELGMGHKSSLERLYDGDLGASMEVDGNNSAAEKTAQAEELKRIEREAEATQAEETRKSKAAAEKAAADAAQAEETR